MVPILMVLVCWANGGEVDTGGGDLAQVAVLVLDDEIVFIAQLLLHLHLANVPLVDVGSLLGSGHFVGPVGVPDCEF